MVAEPHAEAAIFNFNILSMTGTGILFAGIVSGLLLGYSPGGPGADVRARRST